MVLTLVGTPCLRECVPSPEPTTPRTTLTIAPSPLPLQTKNQKVSVSHFLPTSRRIVQFSEGKEPKPGDRVVYVDGAFDLFHLGHIQLLKHAKEMGDFLIVGVHDDPSVNAVRGSNYPVMNLHERVLSVLACKVGAMCGGRVGSNLVT